MTMVKIVAKNKPEKSIELLREQVKKGTELLNARPLTDVMWDAWKTVTREFLERAFGSGSEHVKKVMSVGTGWSTSNEVAMEKHRASSIENQLILLSALIDILESEVEDTTRPAPPRSKSGENRVFIVHGHDEASLHATARFLERLHLPAIVLREQPNQGRTIIEKFVDHSNVGFAVVLLTPDDRGGPFETVYEEQSSRARQNVVLELGFFLGKLGRHRVCALYRKGVEIPSDYSGVLFVPFDEGGAWRLALAKEMQAAGLPIDMNKAV